VTSAPPPEPAEAGEASEGAGVASGDISAQSCTQIGETSVDVGFGTPGGNNVPFSGAEAPVTCPVCGDVGAAGQPCRQCGATLPTVNAVATSASGTATLRLPSGERVVVPRGREVLIGRMSDIPEIARALEPFDVVGRRHCFIAVSSAENVVSVRDPGSTNGTWVGDDPYPLRAGEPRLAPLPARIRLGQHLAIIVEGMGL
jgi:hypothetical protein